MGKGLEVSNSMGYGRWGPEARTLWEGPSEQSMEGTLNRYLGSWGLVPWAMWEVALETGIVEEGALRQR